MQAVDWLHNHVKHRRSDYAQEILDQLHGSRIYLDESQKQEAARRFGSFNAFRQAVMESITVANEGDTSLDSFWQEMSALYPDVFDGEMTAGDMPGVLADVIDRLRNEDTSLLEYAYRQRLDTQQKEISVRYQESRAKAVEGRHKTEMRHKIRKVILCWHKFFITYPCKKTDTERSCTTRLLKSTRRIGGRTEIHLLR